MRLYLGNKMVGRPGFNHGWFDEVAPVLRALPVVTEVFNPAEHDRSAFGFDGTNYRGTLEELKGAGFVRAAALLDDWKWIGTYSEGMIAGPDWRNSPGTISEIACHQALSLPVWEYKTFMRFWNHKALHDLVLPSILEIKYEGDGLTCDECCGS